MAFSDEQITTLRSKLGVAEDADEATILAALDEALDERADEPAGGKAETPAVPEGMTLIPTAKLADLEAGSKLAHETATTLRNKERDAFLDSVRGKFLPTSRAGWEKEYDRDPEGTRAHFKAAPVLIPEAELGHADEPTGTPAVEEAEIEAFASSLGLTKEALCG